MYCSISRNMNQKKYKSLSDFYLMSIFKMIYLPLLKAKRTLLAKRLQDLESQKVRVFVDKERLRNEITETQHAIVLVDNAIIDAEQPTSREFLLLNME